MPVVVDDNWERAPRGQSSGTTGYRNAAERAKIPYALSRALCVAIERELGLEGRLDGY